MRSVVKLGAVFVVFAVAMALAQPRKGPGMRRYDPSTEKTITGTIQDVQQVQRARMAGIHILVKTDTETVDVRLGPSSYIENQGFHFAKGDTVEIVASKATAGGAEFWIAREVTKEGKKLTLRDSTGKPMWSRGGQTCRGCSS